MCMIYLYVSLIWSPTDCPNFRLSREANWICNQKLKNKINRTNILSKIIHFNATSGSKREPLNLLQNYLSTMKKLHAWQSSFPRMKASNYLWKIRMNNTDVYTYMYDLTRLTAS